MLLYIGSHEITALKKTLLFTVVICTVLSVYGIYENIIFIIPMICTMMPLVLTAIALGFDTKSKFEQFAFSLRLTLITLVASVFISAVQLPFVLKFGAEKGRLIMIITYFVIFALATFLREKSDLLMKIANILNKSPILMICAGITLTGLLIIGIAVKSSIVIMEKKEY